MSIRKAVLAASFVCIATPVALACMHAGGGPNAQPVTQSGQQAIVVHHGGVQDLVLQADYQGLSAATLGWVVPVPAAPTDYGVVDSSLFRTVNEWVNLRREMPQPRSRVRGAPVQVAATSPLRFLEPASVGPYAIQPIQGNGPTAATALNQWMEQNEFTPLPDQTLRYYVERNWTFLAIKVSPNEGESLEAEAGVPPLRITFPTDRAVYPLKLSTHMGVFPVRIYMFTAEALRADVFEGAKARGFEIVTGGIHLRHEASAPGTLRADINQFEVSSAPESLRPLLSRLGASAHLSVLFNEHFNREGGAVENRASHWAEDLSVPGLPEGQVLVGARAPAAEPATMVAAAEPEPTMAPATATHTEEESEGCSASGASQLPALALLLLFRRERKRRPGA